MGYLDEALQKGTSAAPNRLYAVLMGVFGLATIGMGFLWVTEKPLPPPTPAEIELYRHMNVPVPSRSSDSAKLFALLFVTTVVLGLSWWAVRRRQGIQRPASSRLGGEGRDRRR